MLKLLIADDEKIIRETISHLINWESLGITLMGTAKDGIEAYHMILDQYPDIVLTDIKMPGLSGLDLIQKIYEVNQETQFIILTGYGEFEYAKTAMKYGIRHYLLKPCNEDQIIRSLKELIQERAERLASTTNRENHKSLMNQFHKNLIVNLINDGLAKQGHLEENQILEFQPEYSKYIDFYTVSYEISYLHYLDECNKEKAIRAIEEYRLANFPGISFHIIYVHHSLLFFFQSFRSDYEEMDTYLANLHFLDQTTSIQYHRNSYRNLQTTFSKLIHHIKRYELIYYSDGTTLTIISNYKNIIQNIQKYTEQIYVDDKNTAKLSLQTVLQILSSITDIDFLKQLVSSIIVISSAKNFSFSTLSAAEFLVDIGATVQCESILQLLEELLTDLYEKYHTNNNGGRLSTKIKAYVMEHIAEPNLSLKWIADNYLYMNVDYVSKRFVKETGQNFSKYLTDTKVNRAKELLAEPNQRKIQEVAEMVGCGNNPPYFNQIFKKSTGMSPGAYLKTIR